jgi:hypothetical protein
MAQKSQIKFTVSKRNTATANDSPSLDSRSSTPQEEEVK